MDSQDFQFELAKNFINRKFFKELLQFKNVQTIQKAPLIMSDIVEKKIQKDEKSIYDVMKNGLSQEFSDFRYLARGNKGYVILAKEKLTNKRFAIKGRSVRDEEGKVENEDDFEDAKKEIEILSQCRGSPYVLNMINSIDLEKNQFLYLVFTEYQGTLQDIIDNTQDKILNEISTIKYAKDIAEGLLHIHNKGYFVNDFKMEYILIDYNDNAVVTNFEQESKVKRNNGYAYNEYQGNNYFQAPECVDKSIVKEYENEYKKLAVETQMKPNQRSEACSFGYLIYTMLQGKKYTYQFIHEKHKPLVYDDNFKVLKYSKQLQYIIDGLTKFIPSERLSITEALEIFREIISIELNQDQKFQIQVSEQTQLLSQNHLKGIEFIEQFDKKYYPVVKNEDTFIQELLAENYGLQEKLQQLQNENKSLKEGQESLKKILNEGDNKISEIQVVSNTNIYKSEQEINGLKQYQENENLKNQLKNVENQNLSLQQKQDSLQADGKQKDQHIFQVEQHQLIQGRETELLNQNSDLEIQKICFQEDYDRTQKQNQDLEKNIQEIQNTTHQTIQELEEKIFLYPQGIQQNQIIIQIPQSEMTQQQNFKESSYQSQFQQNQNDRHGAEQLELFIEEENLLTDEDEENLLTDEDENLLTDEDQLIQQEIEEEQEQEEQEQQWQHWQQQEIEQIEWEQEQEEQEQEQQWQHWQQEHEQQWQLEEQQQQQQQEHQQLFWQIQLWEPLWEEEQPWRTKG